MSYLDRLSNRSELMHNMADTVGADFGTALIEGRLGGMELRSMYLSCARCDGVEACVDWLERHAGGAALPPEFCRNRAALARLHPE